MLKKIIKKIIPSFVVGWYHFVLAFLGAAVYGFPSRRLEVIGVTGTNGKSTVVKMISRILEEEELSAASFSSINIKVGKEDKPNVLRMTMPGRFALQGFLKRAADKGCRYAILEVTSEGIKQYRHKFIDFKIAVFTNLSPEHIESHGSFENYKRAKGKLFEATKGIHVLNLDDKNTDYFLSFPAEKKYGYGFEKEVFGQKNLTIIKAENPASSAEGITFEISDTLFNVPVLGRFNISNALAAICVGLSQGVSLEKCRTALVELSEVPGRMELVIKEPFKVVVDYAFTPNALEKVYGEVRSNFRPGKMICVIGAAGGGRDKWKRPVLGKIARQHCDLIIVTNEDPYDENPEKIIDQVMEGTGAKAEKILDRRKAIREALIKAVPGDAVIITGKGSEPCIMEKGRKVPWDDREVVREEFSKRNHGQSYG